MMQWYLEKILRGQYPENIWYPLGTAVHDAIELAIVEDRPIEEVIDYAHVSFEDAIAHVTTGIMTTPRRNLENAHEEITTIVNNFYRSVMPESSARNPMYSGWQWPPTVEHLVKIDYPGHGIRTQIDAIFFDSDNEEFAIVDWKSGTTPKADPMQLHIYYYALVQQGFPDSGFNGWFHHLYADRIQVAAPYPGHDVVAEWLRYTEALKEADVFPAFPDWYCKYCRVKDYCPVFDEEAFKEATKDITHEWVKQEDIF